MTNRERQNAILHYQSFDRMPVVHFGWWDELLDKWCAEGHLTKEEITGVADGNAKDKAIADKLGFDYNYYTTFQPIGGMIALDPQFEEKVVASFPDGSAHVLNCEGAVVLKRPEAGSIPAEISHTLTDHKSWEEHYLPRLKWNVDRIDEQALAVICKESETRTEPLGIYLGSLFGQIRNWMGVEGVSYLYADDEDLYDEIIAATADIQYQMAEKILESGAVFDFGHFWEDIAFRNGPLVTPSVFHEKVGPHYKRMTELCLQYGIDIVSLDCDGVPDSLIPTWLKNGVNTMFPIEVGVWGGNFATWRGRYGQALRGVGGMNKNVFAIDYSAVDKEIERLLPIISLGGYIPCPDHRIPPDAIWENVQYYCEQMKRLSL